MRGSGAMKPALPRRLAADIETAIRFSTRIPIGRITFGGVGDFTRALWALPVAGAAVGAIAAVVYAAAAALGVPTLAAAALSVCAGLVATGALHEDGLSDTADGFGGGATRARKLDIMRDSRVGAYGACAVAMSLVLRTAALAAVSGPGRAALALIAAHAAARAVLPAFMLALPPARADGLSAAAGRPSPAVAVAALALGLAALGAAFAPARAAAAVAVLALVFFAMARLCRRQIGGQTGDTLGALEQAAEIAILLCAAAH
jgi:adenosylcobinamide-GDP ribazoletransferase